MSVTPDTPFRAIGDVSLTTWDDEMRRLGSPMLPVAAECVLAASPHGALALVQAARESTYGTTDVARRTNNPLGLLDYTTGADVYRYDGKLPFRKFASWAAAFAEFSRRLSDLNYKAGVYAPADLPLSKFVRIYVAGPGPEYANGESAESVARYLRRVIDDLDRLGAMPSATTSPPPPIPSATDPISVIVGGRPYRVEYGWLADAGLDYYGYGVGHGTQRPTQHPAIDVPIPYDTPLYAPAPGVVDCVGTQGTPRWGQACGAYNDYGDAAGGQKRGIGNVTILLDGGVKLTLGHCRTPYVSPGQRVAAGQKVATSGGMNGAHCHVETSVERGGTYRLVEPVAALRAVVAGAAPKPTPAPKDPAPVPPVLVPLRIDLADGAGPNRPRTPLDGNDLWITVHETANPAAGANAEMHQDFVNRGGGPDGVSFHFAVDDREAVQILPLNEVGYHAGDGCNDRRQDTGCFRSVAIETCVNAGGDWAKTKRNLSGLIATLVAQPGRFEGGAGKRFSFDRIEPHRAWSGKNCPTKMLAEGSLPQVVADARAFASGISPAPPAKHFPVALPDDVVEALFPEADPNGVLTKRWLEWVKAGEFPAYLDRQASSDGWVYWIFSGGRMLRSKGATVEVVGKEAA